MSEAYWKERAERLEAALRAVADESRTLRQCGPYEEDALDLHNALGRAVNLACGVIAQQDSTPQAADDPWESGALGESEEHVRVCTDPSVYEAADQVFDGTPQSEGYYNCSPLTVERLRQSARMTRENMLHGLPDSAWQVGIQRWAADQLDGYIERQPVQDEADEALDTWVALWEAMPEEVAGDKWFSDGWEVIRRTLASRQRVPDEIRRLPNQLKCYMEDCSRMNQDERAYAFGVAIEAVQRAIAESGGE